MLKKLAVYLTAVVVLVPLAVALVPLVYGLFCMLAFALPIAFVLSTIEDARDGSASIRSKEVLLKLLLAIVFVPIGFIAFAAPLRAVLLATLSFFPEWMGKFNDMHAFIYDFFVPVFGGLSAYWVDLSWGLLGAGTIFLFALCDSIRRNRLTRQIEILPTATVRSVAIGLAELKGKAVPLGKRSSNTPIIREWRDDTGDGPTLRRDVEPFYLDDGTGRILVDPTGVFIKTDRQYFDVGLHQAILKQFESVKGFPETRLMPGDTVYLVGNVQINRDPRYSEYGDTIVKPKKSSLLSMNFYDLFFLSNVSERALLDGFRKSIHRGWLIVAIFMALAAWLSAFSLTNILQIEASNVDAAPEYLRRISTPTTLEREITVSGIGRDPTVHFVEMLKEGDDEKTEAIMQKFGDLQLTGIALPILKTLAMNIEYPGFGIANHWLSKLGMKPRNEWGIEFSDKGSRYPNESRVLRMMIRYHDNRLFATYRAFVDDKMVTKLHEIRRKDVIIKLVNKETGKSHTAEFATHSGVNASDDVEAFEFLYPGVYELEAYIKTTYRTGDYLAGSRNRKALDIRLEE